MTANSNSKQDRAKKPEVLETLDLETGQSINQKKGLLGGKVLLIITSVLVLAIMMIVVINVAGRSLFRAPIWGSVEMVGLIGILFIPLALCYTELARGHITVDILMSRLSGRTRRTFSFLSYALGLICIVLLLWGGYKQIIYIAETPGSYTPDLNVPMLPFKIFWFVECLVLGGCLVWNLLQVIKRRSNK
jgi:TRAP-type C4-dicarboxylate transport system permease small subunit